MKDLLEQARQDLILYGPYRPLPPGEAFAAYRAAYVAAIIESRKGKKK
jgi:hypothetical protein